MFDQKTLKATKIGQIALAVNIVVFCSIGIIIGKSDEDGWFGMTGMFVFHYLVLSLCLWVLYQLVLIHV